MIKLDHKTRYLQLAFNGEMLTVQGIVPTLPNNPRIWLEAGTPFIKRYGLQGIREMRALWSGGIVADLKTTDGAVSEVKMVHQVGATAATVLASAPLETLNLFIQTCAQLNMISMIDTLGNTDPLAIIRQLAKPPDVVVLHRGRDEESTRGKVIQYRHVNRLRSKYDVLISAAGGVDLKEARSAIFNGANIVVANIVTASSALTGIRVTDDVAKIAQQFLNTME